MYYKVVRCWVIIFLCSHNTFYLMLDSGLFIVLLAFQLLRFGLNPFNSHNQSYGPTTPKINIIIFILNCALNFTAVRYELNDFAALLRSLNPTL